LSKVDIFAENIDGYWVFMDNAAQPETTPHNSKTRREIVEEKAARPETERTKFPKTHVNFWRVRLRRQRYGSKQTGTYRELPAFYVRIYYQGRGHAFSLHTLNETAAATQARDIYLRLLREGWDPVLRRFRSAPEPVAQNPMVGQFLAEVSAKAGLRPRTLRNYSNCFRTIVAEVFNVRAEGSKFDYRGQGNAQWRARIDAVKLIRITPARVQAWKVARLKAAGESPAVQRSAKRTINSYIRCSRALFSRKILKFVNLVLPSPLPFEGVALEQAGSMRYQSSMVVADLVAAANKELKREHPEAYKIFVLGLFAGLRRNEIDGLEWSALGWSTNVIRVKNTDVLHLKSDESEGVVAVDHEVIKGLKAFHKLSQSNFVVTSQRPPRPNSELAYYRCEQHFDFLNEWLRGKGIDANKPIHELRKELGALVVSKHGIYAASRVLRHSDIGTTARHYADQKHRISVGLGKLLAEVVPRKRRRVSSKVTVDTDVH
jgi:integrase